MPAVTYRRTSVPEAKKRSRNNRLSSPSPVVPQLLLWLLPTGIPHSERLLGRPLGPKLYATAMVPIDSLLQRRYRTLQADHLFLVYRSTPRRGMCTSSNNKNGTIGPRLGAFRGIGLTTSTPRFWHAIVLKVSRRREWEITGKPDASRTIFHF